MQGIICLLKGLDGLYMQHVDTSQVAFTGAREQQDGIESASGRTGLNHPNAEATFVRSTWTQTFWKTI